jgi:hypothetical protein
MNYKVISNKKDKNYSVYETSTDQIIKTFEKMIDAKNLMKKLNLGGGFDGQTPSFFLIKTEVV